MRPEDDGAEDAAGRGLPALPVLAAAHDASGRAARPLAAACDASGRAARPLAAADTEVPPERKRLNHRGPLNVDVSCSWYFITICAEDHMPWSVVDGKCGRAARPLAAVAEDLFSTVRHYVKIGKWHVALFLIMPDHLHLIVRVSVDCGGAPRRPNVLESVLADFKHVVARRFGLKFQRDFWDMRLRNETQFAEKFSYICNNPVRKGLCGLARDWPYVIAFDRVTGEELQHR